MTSRFRAVARRQPDHRWTSDEQLAEAFSRTTRRNDRTEKRHVHKHRNVKRQRIIGLEGAAPRALDQAQDTFQLLGCGREGGIGASRPRTGCRVRVPDLSVQD